MNYRINSSDIPNREARNSRYKRRCKSEIPIDEYVNSMGNSKYDATVIETLFNIKGTKCAICLDVLNQPTIINGFNIYHGFNEIDLTLISSTQSNSFQTSDFEYGIFCVSLYF